MRLRQFIIENSEQILTEFEDFARTHTDAGETMDIAALRDHAAAMLSTIIRDMDQVQSDAAQERKSKGDAPAPTAAGPTAAEQHGSDRAASGFSLKEMFAEYRALRASVLRLWTEAASRTLDEEDVDDLTRFNEAIDQSLAESITRFSTDLERSREMYLAILGHDLRSPLGAVVTASEFLVEHGELEGRNLTMATRILSSGNRMRKLIADLLDFASTRLGRRIPIERTDVDLGRVAAETVEEIHSQYPDRELHLDMSGDVSGQWDGQRVSQALSNLVGNAVQHGAEDSAITIEVRDEPETVMISVHNLGPVIEEEERAEIFDPFKRIYRPEQEQDEPGSMGLGLYIARQIAVAHGGWIDVRSTEEEGTTFEMRLPRRPDPPS